MSKRAIESWHRLLAILSVASVVGLCSFAVLCNWYVLWMHYWGFFIVELFTAIVIIDIISNPHCLLRNLFTLNWLLWIGSISYGLYLWRYPILRTISSLSFEGWSKFSLGLLTTFSIAILSYYILHIRIAAPDVLEQVLCDPSSRCHDAFGQKTIHSDINVGSRPVHTQCSSTISLKP